MKTAELDRTFLPRDVYPKWKRLVAQAQTSITVYAPLLTDERVGLATIRFDEGCPRIGRLSGRSKTKGEKNEGCKSSVENEGQERSPLRL